MCAAISATITATRSSPKMSGCCGDAPSLRKRCKATSSYANALPRARGRTGFESVALQKLFSHPGYRHGDAVWRGHFHPFDLDIAAGAIERLTARRRAQFGFGEAFRPGR